MTQCLVQSLPFQSHFPPPTTKSTPTFLGKRQRTMSNREDIAPTSNSEAQSQASSPSSSSSTGRESVRLPSISSLFAGDPDVLSGPLPTLLRGDSTQDSQTHSERWHSSPYGRHYSKSSNVPREFTFGQHKASVTPVGAPPSLYRSSSHGRRHDDRDEPRSQPVLPSINYPPVGADSRSQDSGRGPNAWPSRYDAVREEDAGASWQLQSVHHEANKVSCFEW